MNRYLWLLMLTPLVMAGDDQAARGAVIYRTTCAVAYCHGSDGKPGRAPGFVGRSLTAGYIMQTVSSGIPNTSMPPFEKVLEIEDIQAVAAYLVSLGSVAGAEGHAAAPVKLPPDIERGRVLFFDPGRMGSCGYCHEVGGRGALVSVALQDLHTARLDLNSIETATVLTARPPGEDPFPAVVAEKSAASIRVYDLSSRLPVLRSFAPAEVTLTPGARWQHTVASSLYSAGELDAIERYLKWMAAR
jgi:mono/diheme cytochrome c family protein